MTLPNEADFTAMLQALQSPDNALRHAAEAQYNALRDGQPTWTMDALAQTALTTSLEVRTMSLVLLRKFFATTCTVFNQLPPDAQANVKSLVLRVFSESASTMTRKSASACLAALAAKVAALQQPWDELWNSLLHALQEPSGDLPIGCCEVLTHTATLLASTYLKSRIAELAAGFRACIVQGSADLQIAAFEAVAAITATIDAKEVASFRPLVPPMLDAIAHQLNVGNYKGAASLLSNVVSMVEQSESLFNQHGTALLHAMMQIASAAQLPQDVRHMAVEVLASYAEAAPKSIRRVPNFVQVFLELLVQYLMNPPLHEDWETSCDEEDDDKSDGPTDFDVGSTTIDRLSIALGARSMQQPCQQVVLKLLQSNEWQERNAGLTVLTYAAEGLHSTLSAQLPSVLQLVVPLLNDENKYVRCSAASCVSQFSNDFSPVIQLAHHIEIVPALAALLRDPVPRIQSVAAAALNCFYDNVDDEGDDDEDPDEDNPQPSQVLSVYIADLCSDLVILVESSPLLFVKCEALGALSAIISACKTHLRPFTEHLVPVFQRVLSWDEPHGGDALRKIRQAKCKALECTTLLAASVGREYFAAYSHPVCEYLIAQLREGIPNDDMRLRYILRGWTCMVECLKEEVLPYLDGVMPSLLNVANLKCDVEMVTTEVGEDDATGPHDDDEATKLIRVCLPGLGESTVRIHTSLIEDKELATNIIFSIVEELKGAMKPYLGAIVDMAVGLLSFAATSDIRENGAQILTKTVEAYKAADPASLPALAQHTVPYLLSATRDETEHSIISEYLETITAIITAAPNSLNTETVTTLGATVKSVLLDSLKRRRALATKRMQEDDADEQDAIDDQDEDEDYLLGEGSSAVQGLLKSQEAFAPLFVTELLPMVEELLKQSDNVELRTAIGMLCDYVEFAPTHAYHHLAPISSVFLHFSSAPNEDLCQAAMFGLAITTDLCARAFQQPHNESISFVQRAAESAETFLKSQRSVDAVWECVTCNAVSVVLRVIASFASYVDARTLMGLVVPRLPVKGDEVEAKRVHGMLIDWLRADHPMLSANDRATTAVRATVIGKLRGCKRKWLPEGASAVLQGMR